MNRDVDSFGTFLGTVNNLPSSPAIGAPMSMDILKFVKEHGGSVSTLDLLKGVHMPITAIASTLESLKNTNLVEVHSGGEFESVSLTDVGSMVVNFSINKN